MRNTLPKFLLFLLITLALTTCSTNDDNIEEVNNEERFLLKKEIERFNNGTIFRSTEFTYVDNKLTELLTFNTEDSLISIGNIEYLEDQPIQVNEYDGNNNLLYYSTLSYNSNNQLDNYIKYDETNLTAIKHVFAYNNNTVIESMYTGNYTTQEEYIGDKTYEMDANGNITSITTSNYSITYTYDDKNGRFKNVASLNTLNLIDVLNGPLSGGTENNCLSFQFNQSNITDHIDLTYTYNANDYPTTKTEESAEFGTANSTEYLYY
ncbi:hypothetical protein [Oceanihabitans sediminis]|uniref:hypothetical protein n=1 Tax=Oceanihabitans sediminis TaxID=1812012 RepID=UPI00299DEA7E|nr:hypothetical protein [Oceanihabitans sediminis]MDX1773893.1 hypothetical protein [Oceanihabitans sediminis]